MFKYKQSRYTCTYFCKFVRVIILIIEQFFNNKYFILFKIKNLRFTQLSFIKLITKLLFSDFTAVIFSRQIFPCVCFILGYDARENGNSSFKITTCVKVIFIFSYMYFNNKRRTCMKIFLTV